MADPRQPIQAPVPSDPKGTRRAGQRGRQDIDIAGRLRSAQDNLLGRPRLSIRLRLVASLLLCFALCCAFTLVSLDLLHETREKLHLLHTIERLDDRLTLDQGVLSPGHVQRVIEGVKETEEVLRRNPGFIGPGDGDVLPNLLRQAQASQAIMAGSVAPESARSPLLTRTQAAEMRKAEGTAQRLLSSLIAREREALEGILGRTEKGALLLVGILLVLFSAITFLFAHALGSPIARFKGYTARIAGGDFSFIRPARRYRDEFSDLAVAVNQMLAELRAQQSRVVKGAKLAAVGTLASGIAHELNNPLNNISITTEALMEGLSEMSEEEKWRHLQDIYFETERAGEIVKNVLDFTRKEKPDMVALDPAEIVQSTLRLAQNELSINDVALTCDVPAGLPRIRGTSNQLRQVFLNLILNAVQAMPGGGPLSVTAKRHDPDRLCIEIHDEGIGIPPDVLPRIFDPFFTTKEPGQGTGLGLSVSLGIIRNFGGDIHAASEPGKGTTFHVCLPVDDAAEIGK